MNHGGVSTRTCSAVGVRPVPLVTDARQPPRDVTSGAADRHRVHSTTCPCSTVAGNRRLRTSDHCVPHTNTSCGQWFLFLSYKTLTSTTNMCLLLLQEFSVFTERESYFSVSAFASWLWSFNFRTLKWRTSGSSHGKTGPTNFHSWVIIWDRIYKNRGTDCYV